MGLYEVIQGYLRETEEDLSLKRGLYSSGAISGNFFCSKAQLLMEDISIMKKDLGILEKGNLSDLEKSTLEKRYSFGGV